MEGMRLKDQNRKFEKTEHLLCRKDVYMVGLVRDKNIYIPYIYKRGLPQKHNPGPRKQL